MKTHSRKCTATDIHVGNRIRQLRLTSGWSQSDLAKITGVTFQQIQKYEGGRNRVSPATLNAYSGHFGVPVQWFFDGAPDTTSNASATTDAATETFLSDRHGIAIARALHNRPELKEAIADLCKRVSEIG